jgi:hypothetical protein
MAQQRQRLNSMSDHSTPSSDVSDENSEALDMSDLRLNLESTSELTDCERQQIESAFNALGTEVSSITVHLFTLLTLRPTHMALVRLVSMIACVTFN